VDDALRVSGIIAGKRLDDRSQYVGPVVILVLAEVRFSANHFCRCENFTEISLQQSIFSLQQKGDSQFKMLGGGWSACANLKMLRPRQVLHNHSFDSRPGHEE
jgi:hypothetical protein